MFLVIILGIFLFGCAQIKYTTKDGGVDIFEYGGRNVEFSVVGKRNFYLWGYFPENSMVFIDRVIRNTTGYLKPAEVSIEDYQTIPQFLASVVSLGLYIPKSYRIRGYAIRPKQYEK